GAAGADVEADSRSASLGSEGAEGADSSPSPSLPSSPSSSGAAAAAGDPAESQKQVPEEAAVAAAAAPPPQARVQQQAVTEPTTPEVEAETTAAGGDEPEVSQEAEVEQEEEEEEAPSEDPSAALRRLRDELSLLGVRGDDSPSQTEPGSLPDVEHAIAALSTLLAEAVRTELQARAGSSSSGASLLPTTTAASSSPSLTSERLASLVAAAAVVRPALPAPLLAAAVRLLAGMREVPHPHIAPVVAACLAAGFTPPAHHLEPLALLVFSSRKAEATASSSNSSSSLPPPSPQQQHQQKKQAVRALHTCAAGLSRLGYRLNNKQFGVWADAVSRCPHALRPAPLLQLLAACVERGFTLRSGAVAGVGPGALLAAALSPPARLQQLSARELVTVARFAAQQGLKLGAAQAAVLQGRLGAGALRELSPGELVELLQALKSAGGLQPLELAHSGSGGASSCSCCGGAAAAAWLDAHAAALLPEADTLQVEEVVSLLQTYGELRYIAPPALLLGLSLALEPQLPGPAPLSRLLPALELLLLQGRLEGGFRPYKDLATAIKEDLLPRLVLAALVQQPPQQQAATGGAAAAAAAPAAGSVSAATAAALPQPERLSAVQRLQALEVLAAARVRPHPAQLAALVDMGLAGEGLMEGLSGEQLARLLWHCAAFRALPSWRFLGEWLQLAARCMWGSEEEEEEEEGSSGGRSKGGARKESERMSPQALVRVGWCLGQMGVQPERGWQERYHAALLAALPVLGAEELSLAAHSALVLRVRPEEEWMAALMAAVLGRMGEVDAAAAARVLHFAASGEVEVSREWMQAFFLHTHHLVDPHASSHPASASAPTPTSRQPATPDQITVMLRALAQLGFRPPHPW
ncbi:hypothetical protein Agub_g4839, partial [Astrephomene gubernaculifera]